MRNPVENIEVSENEPSDLSRTHSVLGGSRRVLNGEQRSSGLG